jgi:hypothetical protein
MTAVAAFANPSDTCRTKIAFRASAGACQNVQPGNGPGSTHFVC